MNKKNINCKKLIFLGIVLILVLFIFNKFVLNISLGVVIRQIFELLIIVIFVVYFKCKPKNKQE